MSEYGATDLGDLQKADEEMVRGNRWQPKEGDNPIRLLPPWAPGEKLPFRLWDIHWVPTPRGKNRPVPCLRKIGQPKCAICEEVARRMAQAQGDADRKLAQSMTVRVAALYNILDLSTPSRGPLVYAAPEYICREINKTCRMWSVAVDDPEKGFNAVLTKSKTAKPMYSIHFDRMPSPIQNKGCLSALNDLSQQYDVFTYEEQQAILRGEQVIRRGMPPVGGLPESLSTPAPAAPPIPASTPPPSVPALGQAISFPPPTPGEKKDLPPKCVGHFAGEADPVCSQCSSKLVCRSTTEGKIPF